MELSRRTLLSTVPASALLALAQPLRARAEAGGGGGSAGAVAGADGGIEALVGNAVAVFAGTAESNARPELAAKLEAVQAAARDHIEALDAAGPGELFQGVGDLATSDVNLTKSYQYLYEIALATRTPPGTSGASGSGLSGDEAAQRRVVDGLAWLHDTYYGDQSKGYYGNWFNWEIGISQHVSKILVLLRDQLAAWRPGLAAAYTASMDAYLRNGKDGDVDLDSRFHTGANLADITTDRILQGAALGDGARIAKAVADQVTVLATIDPYDLRHGVTDGFYADGSFLQHASVAYTGSYGTGLLSRVVGTLKLLEDTGYLPGDDLAGVARGWVVDAFAPVIFEGWMMEIVKGRGASRTKSGYRDASTVVEAVTDLSGHASGDDATALKAYVKYVAEAAGQALDPAAFVSPVTIARYADIAADASVPAGDIRPPAYTAAFNAMDRTVHRRPGWAFALARSSRRISKYEYMSGENLTPWFLGDGAHHLYLAGQDQGEAYGVDHYTTVSPYRLAGVTAPVERRATVPELYGQLWYDNPDAGFTASSEAQNTYVYFPCATAEFSGGAVLGDYGVAGFVQSDDAAYAAQQAGELPDDFVAYRNASATKSWFLFDDEIVVLAAGVGDAAGRAVTTTVDTRVADPADTITLTGGLRDGGAWPGLEDGDGSGTRDADGFLRPNPSAAAPLAWLRYADADRGAAVGYVFLRPGPGAHAPDPAVGLGTVTRSRRSVNVTNADTEVGKQVFTVAHEQPPGAPAASLAYALLPNATERQVRATARRPPFAVLANTPRLQALAHTGLGLLAVNSFRSGTRSAGRLTVTGRASVLLREESDGTTSLAVADPTTRQDTVSVVVRGRPLRVAAADDGVSVRRVPGGTRLDVTTRHSYGRSFTARLRPAR